MNNSRSSFKRGHHGVRSGRTDKEWGELMEYRKELLREKTENAEMLANVNPDLMLRIVYDAQTETHGGYCSDPENIKTINRTYTSVVGLPTAFKRRDIYVDGMLQPSIPLTNNLLHRLFTKESESCGQGSGYCGCKTRFSIRSATITKAIKHNAMDEAISVNDIV